MSVENVMKLRTKVNQDPGLRQLVLDTLRLRNGIDTIELGRQHGFEFSAADVNVVFNRADLELTDFELEVVAGGGIQSPTNTAGCERLVTPGEIAGQSKTAVR